MNIQNQLIEFAQKKSLKEKALASVDKIMDANIQADKERGIDFLEGQDRTELIYEFGRYEFQIDKDDNCRIATKINIYSNKLYGPSFDVTVGYYTELTDLSGEHIDEFLIFDWSPINFNIDSYIERINKIVPQRYFKRNVPEYEFATYINHTISLFQGKQFDGAILFVKRGLDYLEKPDKKEVHNEYLIECLNLFKGMYHFIKNNEIVEHKKLSEYRIEERIKNEKRAITRKS